MPSFDFPSSNPIVSEDSRAITPVWVQWFQLVQNVVLAAYASGSTAQRPTKGLWIGRQFYDTTLGYPVFVHGVNPTVWHDAAGNPA